MECYLDNSATTAVTPPVAACALHMMTEEFGNPSSLHRRGFLAERAMTEARGQVAEVLHCRADEVIFTSGGTESNNIALLGAAHAMKRRGNRIVTTAVEHHSVLAICKALEAEGFEVVTVSPDESGHITPAAMAAACNEKTILVSCMMVNSETGMIHDIPAIAAACRPQVLICDEPTTALDVTIQAQILELIKAMQKKYDLTTIYITHDLGVVANVADRIAVMYAGDIVELGTCDEVFYDPRHPYTWALLSSLPQLGTKDEPLYSIQGTPPNLFHEVKGDAFAPRNPKALKIDFVERPPFFEVTPTHYARTWLMDPRAPKVEPPEHVRILREKGVNRVG